jgi:hypothetical protein
VLVRIDSDKCEQRRLVLNAHGNGAVWASTRLLSEFEKAKGIDTSVLTAILPKPEHNALAD